MGKAHSLIGKSVSIFWKDPDYDWHAYKVLSIEPPFMKVQGVADSEGSPYEGGPMWVNTDTIDYILEEDQNGS